MEISRRANELPYFRRVQQDHLLMNAGKRLLPFGAIARGSRPVNERLCCNVEQLR